MDKDSRKSVATSSQSSDLKRKQVFNDFNLGGDSRNLLPAKYKLMKTLGSGGMASVYLAWDQEKKREVAIKMLRVDPSTPTSNKSRFREEMKLARYIKSPHVVRFYEGLYSSEIKYIAMEYVNGRMLKDIIEENKWLIPEQAVDFAIQIARGFSDIHAQNIVHRDLKTSNIMVNNNDEIKIIDFGIAISDDSARFTQTGKVIGSVHYLAPELIDQEEASFQSDIYALGIILYEMLVGFPPHRGKNAMETAMKHKTENIPWVNKIHKNIPQSLANIVFKATAKNKADRYLTMREMAADLATCFNPERNNEKPIQLESTKKEKGILNFLRKKKK